jgi:bacillithiol biosynthesis deacetylase BshB1
MNRQSDVDVLVLGAHPDDAEISCGGTILKCTRAGLKVVLVDMTRGEKGTKGTAAIRLAEAEAAMRELGAIERVNLELPDTELRPTVEARNRVVSAIRRFRPRILLSHHERDAHPDHEATGLLAKEACFHAGLKNVLPGTAPHRPRVFARFLSHQPFEPSFCVDVSDVYEQKRKAILCFASQFEGGEKGHFMHGMDPLERAEIRNRYFGSRIGVAYAEAFALEGPVPLLNLSVFL